ncbi:tape measure protein [Pseudomonas abietaniphila]|uniref:tape measure protein n=1 Tax=Pseudomonas abietaniphila TaxID=89065 RepID=UPI0007831B5E|nr:tape measure protein [Pseudomonas abietaniphila]
MAGQEVRGMLIRLEATTAQLRQEMDRADASVTKATGRIDTQLSKVDTAFDRAARSAQSAASILKGALSLAVGGASVSAIIDQAEAYTTVANRLKLVTSSSKDFTDAQSAVFSIAQRSGQPLGATAELYQRIATNQKELKLSGQGVAGIVETISKTLVISGTSAASADAALVQLGQSFASGTLRGEELNSVLEQAPALAQAIAKGMGKTVGELRSLGADGKLTAAAVVAALQAEAGAVDDLFNQMQSTIGTALTRIQTSFTRIIGETDKFSGTSVSLAGAINQASRALDQIKVPEAIAVVSKHAETLSTVLGVVLYAALGKVAAGMVQWTAASGTSVIANQKALAAAARTAQQDLLAAEAKQVDARALVARANQELQAAQSKVASDRARQQSEIGNIQALQATMTAEVALERQRYEAQISEQGRLASTARLTGLLEAQATVTGQLTAAEQKLAVTTVATSAEIQVANARVTASKVALAETTLAVNAASVATEKAAAAASIAGRAWGSLKTGAAGLLGLLGGPVGLAFMAGAVALSFVDFSDKSKTLMGDLGDLGKSVDQVRTEFNKLNEDQQRAQINTWKDKQLGATLAVENAYKDLKESVQSALIEPVNPEMVDPAKMAEQVRSFEVLVAKMDAARASGQSLGPILREAAANGQISPEQLRQWETKAGLLSDNASVAAQVTTRLGEMTGALNQNTTATQANNQAKAGFTTEGEKYLDTIQKQLAGLQDGGNAIKEANRYIAEHADLSEADRVAILSTANAIEVNKAATKAAKDETKLGNAAAREAATELKNQQKALEDLTAKSAISTKSANDLADAYLAGIGSIREITLQQKVEEELLKTGADARDKVTESIRNQMAAEDRRDVAKNIADLRVEASQTLAQATATLRGADALEAFNVQKAMQVALVGKNIEYGSKEYDQLLEATKAQLDHNKALEQAGEANSIVDRLYPQTKLLRDYTQEQEALNKAIELYPEKADAYRDALGRLGVEYEQNQRAATAWGQFTEGAVDRIDDAFADMWKSILSKSGNFMDTLKDSFRQFLAEMLHMAITKPIIVQFASALGIGGAAAQSSGFFGDMGSGSGGGISSLLSNASSVISVAGSKFGQAVMAGWNGSNGILGGIQGAFSNGASYISSAITGAFTAGSATASSAAASLAAGSTQAGYTGAAMQSWVGAANASSTLASLSNAISYIGAAYSVISSFQNYGVKGGATTAGFAAGGAYIGSLVGPIGTAAGAAIGSVIGSFVSGKLFGGSGEKYPDLSTSGQGTYSNGVYRSGGVVQGWQTKAPKYGSSVDAQMDATVAKFSSTLGMLYDVLGNGADVYAYDMMQVRKTSGRYSTTFGATLDNGTGVGLDIHQQFNAADAAEALKHNYDDVMGTFLAKAIVSSKSLPDYFKAQFTDFAGSWDTTADEVIRAIEGVFTRFNGVNDALSLINVNGLKLDNTGLMASDAILDMVGAMSNLDTATASAKDKVDALNKSVSTYYQAFFSADEQFADLTKSLKGAFAGFGLQLPDTRSAYRDMVEDIDVTTAAGQAMFSTLVGLATNANSYYSTLDQKAKDAQQAAEEAAQKIIDGLMGNATSAQSALERAINAQKASINDMLATANTSVSDLTGISGSLSAALKALRGDSDNAVKTLRSQAQATLQSALAQARAGKSLAGFEGLTDALDAVSNNNTDLYASLEDFNREQGRTANVVAELNALNGKQLTSSQQTVKTLQAQLDALDDQLAFAQAQLDALNGVDNSVLTVADAVKAMNAAVVAAIAGLSGKGTATNNGTLIDSVYQSVLGHSADQAGKDYWLGQLSSGAISYSQLEQAIRNAALANGSLPAHASGGYISGPGTGTSDSILARLSNGEYVMTAAATKMFGTGLLNQMNAGYIPAFATGGPVLDISSPSQVFTRPVGRVDDGGGDGGRLEQKVDILIDVIKQIVGPMKVDSNKVRKLLEHWDGDGLPKTTTASATA